MDDITVLNLPLMDICCCWRIWSKDMSLKSAVAPSDDELATPQGSLLTLVVDGPMSRSAVLIKKIG